jgi:hypothetical protein
VEEGVSRNDITLEWLASLRGGLPERCDFCGEPYDNERYPVPEEAGEWACNFCLERWEKQESDQ